MSVTTQKLLGHLAQFASFSKQGEVLCTQSLAYLLKDAEAERAFAALLTEAAAHPVSSGLAWRAESVQADGARPDLEGRADDGTIVVKVEAKLGATLGDGQLESYCMHLFRGQHAPVLVILIPRSREEEIARCARRDLRVQGPSPWRAADAAGEVVVTIITWERVFDAIRSTASASCIADLEQLAAMYRVLNGDVMEPLTSDEEVLAWRDRYQWWATLVDLATRRLTDAKGRVLPLELEQGPPPYCRRYVCRRVSNIHSCYSIGTRDPFASHRTPLWLRFHQSTGHYAEIARRLEGSSLTIESVYSQGHLWFPLDVPLHADRDTMINSVVAQVQRIIYAAYPASVSLEA